MECRHNVINVYLSKYSCATFVCDSCKCEGWSRTLDSFLSTDTKCSDSYMSTCASANLVGIQLITFKRWEDIPEKNTPDHHLQEAGLSE